MTQALDAGWIFNPFIAIVHIASLMALRYTTSAVKMAKSIKIFAGVGL
jgi:hypothetical protein